MDKRLLNAIRITVLTAAIGFMIFGISRGEMQMVLDKAVRICLECIGLG